MVGTFYIPFYFPFGGSKHFFFSFLFYRSWKSIVLIYWKLMMPFLGFFFSLVIFAFSKKKGEKQGICVLDIRYIYTDNWNILWNATGAFQVALEVKNLPANAGDIRDAGLIPGSGRSPGGGHGIPLQYSCLENPMDKGAWRATVHRVSESWTQLKQPCTHTRIKCNLMGII